MPSGDRMPQFVVPGTQLAELLQPFDQLRPGIGDQGQEKATTAGCAQRPCGEQRLFDCQIVALKIDAGKTVNLQIDERGSEPNIALCWGGNSLELRNDSALPTQADNLPCRVMPGPDFSVAHAVISGASSADCKPFCEEEKPCNRSATVA